MDKLLFSVKEASAALNLSEVTIWRMIGDGRLKSVKIGAARRIPATAIYAVVEGGNQ